MLSNRKKQRLGGVLLHQHQFALRHKTARLENIQINTARHTPAAVLAAVPHDHMATRRIFTFCQQAHELAGGVVNRQRKLSRLRQGKANEVGKKGAQFF